MAAEVRRTLAAAVGRIPVVVAVLRTLAGAVSRTLAGAVSRTLAWNHILVAVVAHHKDQ
jgi:hypothetical protein